MAGTRGSTPATVGGPAVRAAAVVACAALALAGCTSSSTKAPSKSGSAAGTAASGSATTTPSAGVTSSGAAGSSGAGPSSGSTTAAARPLPSSCPAVQRSIIEKFIGGKVTVRSTPASKSGVSCEYLAAATKVVFTVRIEQQSAAEFQKAIDADVMNGQTAIPLKGLGQRAVQFQVNGTNSGLSVRTTQGRVFTVLAANKTLAQDKVLINKLIATY